MKGTAYIVSAPSGAGKTTLCSMAVEFFDGLAFSVSFTTRKPREGEIDGIDYHFIDDARFDEMVAEGEFIEYAEVHGNKYGTTKKEIEAALARGEDVLLDIDVQGAEQVRGMLEGGVYVFIIPPSAEECERRLTMRGKDHPDDIKKRVRASVEEIRRAGSYDYILINDDLDDAFERLRDIISAEKSRRERVIGRVKEIFGF